VYNGGGSKFRSDPFAKVWSGLSWDNSRGQQWCYDSTLPIVL